MIYSVHVRTPEQVYVLYPLGDAIWYIRETGEEKELFAFLQERTQRFDRQFHKFVFDTATAAGEYVIYLDIRKKDWQWGRKRILAKKW